MPKRQTSLTIAFVLGISAAVPLLLATVSHPALPSLPNNPGVLFGIGMITLILIGGPIAGIHLIWSGVTSHAERTSILSYQTSKRIRNSWTSRRFILLYLLSLAPVGMIVLQLDTIPSGEIFGRALGAYGFGTFVFLQSFYHVHRYMRISNTPISTVQSLAVGQVAVQGRARATSPTYTSPISNKDCIMYRYHILERKHNNWQGNWFTVKAETEGPAEFKVDDGTDSVLVDPEGADIRLTQNVINVLPGDEPPAYLDDLEGLDNDFWKTDTPKKVVEHRVEPGEEVYVLGRAEPKGTLSPSNAGDLIIKDSSSVFFISDTGKKRVRRYDRIKTISGTTFGLILSVIGLGLMLASAGML